MGAVGLSRRGPAVPRAAGGAEPHVAQGPRPEAPARHYHLLERRSRARELSEASHEDVRRPAESSLHHRLAAARLARRAAPRGGKPRARGTPGREEVRAGLDIAFDRDTGISFVFGARGRGRSPRVARGRDRRAARIPRARRGEELAGARADDPREARARGDGAPAGRRICPDRAERSCGEEISRDGGGPVRFPRARGGAPRFPRAAMRPRRPARRTRATTDGGSVEYSRKGPTMRKHIARRLARIVPVVVLISIVTFALLHLAPGGPAGVLSGTRG